ncbi:MAG: hypothetical protein H0T53_03300 [Herpetosiphonaceae bacterium]|nr:hypothetical protein [Herpetosiphonaceae bacterium]
MEARWDLAAYDRHDQRVLVIEVKNKLDVTAEWAGRFRRNILAHGLYPNAQFFLFAFPDKFYLWTDSDKQDIEAEPNYTIDARPLLQPYFEQAGVTPGQISGQSFEFIVALWLGEIMHSEHLSNLRAEEQWLIDSGLHASILGGRFEHEVVV